MKCRCEKWCNRARTKWCEDCSTEFSNFKSDYAELRILKGEKITMEYKTKEEMKSAIANMEAEIEKMKEALKKEEEKDTIWIPKTGDWYWTIFGDGDFFKIQCRNSGNDCERFRIYNCFKTDKEAELASADLKTMLMLYRLSKESMKKKNEKSCWIIGEDLIARKNSDIYVHSTPFLFSSKEDAEQALELIGNDNYRRLFVDKYKG